MGGNHDFGVGGSGLWLWCGMGHLTYTCFIESGCASTVTCLAECVSSPGGTGENGGVALAALEIAWKYVEEEGEE